MSAAATARVKASAATARVKASAKGNARHAHHAQVAPTNTPWAPALGPSGPRLSRALSGFPNTKRKQSVFRLVRKVSILSNGTVGNAVSPEAATAEANEAAFVERQRLAQLKLAADKAKYALRFQPQGYVIDPRTVRWMQWWDIVMMIALLFTALVTPLEVAFLEGGTVDGLFIINRVVDAAFIVDMVLNFRIAYQEPQSAGGGWVLNQPFIAAHYRRGWFAVDLASILPFWIVPFVTNDGEEDSGSGDESSSALGLLRIVRIVRLLRLLKLARVLKQSRLFKRLETQMEVSYALIKLTQLTTALCLWSHWQACLWGLIIVFEGDDDFTWMKQFEQDEHSHGQPFGPWDKYVASLYFSLMTITSIGYGQMLPVNTFERLICTLLMFFSSTFWCYVIGTASGIAATLDPDGVRFHTHMDALNYFMAERRLPRDLRVQLREFFHNARELHRVESDAELLSMMSPLLQGKVALQANKEWLDNIWYLRAPAGSETDGFHVRMRTFYANIAKNLVIKPYVAQERIPLGFLYILRRGLVVKMWRFLTSGKVWGEDMILDNADLIDHSQGVALTYVEVFSLSRHDLEEVAKEYPEAQRRIRRAARRMAVQRRLLMYMKRHHAMPLKSYIPPTQAKGFEQAPPRLSPDQKLDILLDVDPKAKQMVAKFLNGADSDPLAIKVKGSGDAGGVVGGGGSGSDRGDGGGGGSGGGGGGGDRSGGGGGDSSGGDSSGGGGGNGGDDDSSNGGGTNGNEPAGAQAKDGTGSAGISVKSVQQLLDMHQQLAKSLASIGQVHEEMGNQLKRSLAATTAA